MLFAALLRLSGLSPAEAAAFLGVRRRSVNLWLGPGGAPQEEALRKIYDLIDRQESAAEDIIADWDASGRPDVIDLEVAATDEGAQEAGWPSIGAQSTPAAIAQATLIHVKIRLSVVDEDDPYDAEDAEIVEED